MYASLRRYLPQIAADLLMALFYALLILTIIYCAFEPQAKFTYLNL